VIFEALEIMFPFSPLICLSQGEEDKWKEAFSLFDRDSDGKIGSNEVGTVMRALGALDCPARSTILFCFVFFI